VLGVDVERATSKSICKHNINKALSESDHIVDVNDNEQKATQDMPEYSNRLLSQPSDNTKEDDTPSLNTQQW
jgi:hypothetical protein